MTAAWSVTLACAVLIAAPLAVARAPARIVYLEPVRALQARSADASRPEQLSFEAFGRRFDLVLTPNAALRAAVPTNRPGLVPLEGVVLGSPGSWARITRTTDGFSGVIADGREVFAVEAAQEVAPFVDAALRAPTSGIVVYRLADALIDATAVSCGVVDDDAPVNALALYKTLGAELAALTALAADKQLDVAMVADFEMFQSRGAAAADYLVARMNVVDGLYAAQAGLRIRVGSMKVFDSAQDPFTASSAPDLLQQLATFRRTGTPASQRLGLTHLMTGRELDETTVGIAYLDAICGSQSASLTEARAGKLSTTLISLVAAHEIGHNFGAPHDGEAGKACAGTPTTFLMAPTLASSNTQFSQCSLQQIAPRIAAACLGAVDQVDVDIVAPVASARHGLDVSYSLTFNVRSIGTRTADMTAASFTIPGGSSLDAINAAGGDCAVNGAQADCTLGTLPAGAARTVTLSLTGRAFGTETLFASVTALDDGSPGNNATSVQIVTDPVADLGVTAAVTPANLAVGDDARFTITMTNGGVSDAADARLSVDVPAGLTVGAVDAGGLTCAAGANSIACDPILLAVTDSRTLAFTARADLSGSRAVSAIALSSAIDPDNANNSASATVAVSGGGTGGNPPTPPPPSSGASGGGGGGSLSLLWLAVLAATLALRQLITSNRSFASTCMPGRASTSRT